MRALVVEDDPTLAQQLAARLGDEGFVVEVAADGREGVYFGSEFDFDVAIVDLGLPEIDGLEVIRSLRSREIEVPILILTARDGWQNKVEGLEAGADDYVTKPFHIEEVLARINVLIRRAAGHAKAEVQVGPWRLDTSTRQVFMDERPVDLTAFEYRVLEFLMMNRDRVISKEELTERLYAQDFERDSNTIEVFVGRLRRKLKHSKIGAPIRTLRGQGYRFAGE